MIFQSTYTVLSNIILEYGTVMENYSFEAKRYGNDQVNCPAHRAQV